VKNKVPPASEPSKNGGKLPPVTLQVDRLSAAARADAEIVGITRVIVLAINDALARLDVPDEQADAADRLTGLYRALLPKPRGAEWGALALEVGMAAVRLVGQTLARRLKQPATDEQLAPYVAAVAAEVALQFDAPDCAETLATHLTALRLPLEDGEAPSQGCRAKALQSLRGSLHWCDDESSLAKAVRKVTRTPVYAELARVWSIAVAVQASARVSANPPQVSFRPREGA
jgi:hypothetical protein